MFSICICFAEASYFTYFWSHGCTNVLDDFYFSRRTVQPSYTKTQSHQHAELVIYLHKNNLTSPSTHGHHLQPFCTTPFIFILLLALHFTHSGGDFLLSIISMAQRGFSGHWVAWSISSTGEGFFFSLAPDEL